MEFSAAANAEWVDVPPTNQCDVDNPEIVSSSLIRCVGPKGASLNRTTNSPAAVVFIVQDGKVYLYGFQLRGPNRFVPISSLMQTELT